MIRINAVGALDSSDAMFVAVAASAPADLASEVAAAVATVNGVTHDSAASIEDVSIEDVAVADDTIPDRVARWANISSVISPSMVIDIKVSRQKLAISKYRGTTRYRCQIFKVSTLAGWFIFNVIPGYRG